MPLAEASASAYPAPLLLPHNRLIGSDHGTIGSGGTDLFISQQITAGYVLRGIQVLADINLTESADVRWTLHYAESGITTSSALTVANQILPSTFGGTTQTDLPVLPMQTAGWLFPNFQLAEEMQRLFVVVTNGSGVAVDALAQWIIDRKTLETA